MREESEKERYPSIVEGIHLEVLQYICWEEPEGKKKSEQDPHAASVDF